MPPHAVVFTAAAEVTGLAKRLVAASTLIADGVHEVVPVPRPVRAPKALYDVHCRRAPALVGTRASHARCADSSIASALPGLSRVNSTVEDGKKLDEDDRSR